MLSWSVKHKLIYLGIIFGILFIAVFIPYIFLSYKSPSCSDGQKNSDELGVDCGGGCENLCDFQVISPVVVWSRTFKVAEGFYSAAALIENPNINSKTDDIGYVFTLRNSTGAVIAQKEGRTFIPNNRTILIFEPRFETQEIPTRADFRFTEEAKWKRDEDLPSDIVIRSKAISGIEDSPRLDASIENRSLQDISRLEVSAIVFDGSGKALGASRTFIDDFERGKTDDIVFTWPFPFEVSEMTCEVPVDLMVVFDRSGSMIFDNWDFLNPEPLTTAKNAAVGFLDKLHSNVRVGLVSFSTEASLDLPLSGSSSSVKKAVENISIKAKNRADIWMQETNIAQGLEFASLEFKNNDAKKEVEKVIVLFTDGIPTHPKKSGNPDYAIETAKETAGNIKKNDKATIFSIGLGQEQIDRESLVDISSDAEHYFDAPDASNLSSIFETVAEKICRESPSTVEIITRSVPEV